MTRYVILRDDDTNALTPSAWLDLLYRPFLSRGLPVNLAVIPNVRTHVTYGDGILEGFLIARGGVKQPFLPISCNVELVDYLRAHPAYHVVQHGCHHEFVRGQCEFDHNDEADLDRRFEEGRRHLCQAGFSPPETFVAPYDLMTRKSMAHAAKRYRVISTSWFDRRRLPRSWWPRYFWKKIAGEPHWRMNGTILLSHPRCFLSCHRSCDTMLDEIKASIRERKLTVLVTHWWEFFPGGEPNARFVRVLHELAEYLASASEIRVVRFADVAKGLVPL
ncbi:MAG: DUF2334 domain-containing protein [Verrucomicrobiota bacterium]